MAANLADELLQMILAPSLTIPHEQLISSSPTAFGQNDAVSTASVLLVCKRWLRVATPLLYEAIVVRSTGQSQALVAAFRQNPAFAQHVKKIRLEGAYASLGEILTRCEKMNTLVILFRIYSDANVTGLCRALPLVNPTDVIMHDEWQIDNKKIRQTLTAFCDAIPKWKNFTTFAFPYHHRAGYGSAKIEQPNITRRERLVDALTKSTSLRVISSEIPETGFSVSLPRLGIIPSITFKFTYSSKNAWHSLSRNSILNTISKDSRLSKSSFEFIDIAETSPPPLDLPEKVDMVQKPRSKPLDVSSIPKGVWDIIFAFATIPGYPDPPNMFYGKWREKAPVIQLNATRKHLSLVCRAFEHLVRPMFFTYPLIFSVRSFHSFAKKVFQNPDLGRQVQVLSMDRLVGMAEVDEELCALIPHLSCLLHFIGCGPWGDFGFQISTKAFTLLAEAAGSTLTTITRLGFSPSGDPLPHNVLSRFKTLTVLDIPSYHPRIQVNGTEHKKDSLSNLRELHVGGAPEFLDALSKLSLPRLKSVKFTWITSSVEKFLKACGSQVEDLEFRGFADFTELFSHAPRLVDLRWEPHSAHEKYSLTVAAALSPEAAHDNLERFTLYGILVPGNGEKEQNSVVSAFFESLDFKKFPRLKDITFASYKWPVEERAISKDPLPKMALQVQRQYGVDVKDQSGKPWRPRVQKR